MKLILVVSFAIQMVGSDCAEILKLTGIGRAAARQVQPYADCLNKQLGNAEYTRKVCSEVRMQVVHHRRAKAANVAVDRAVRWLDAMARERAACETHLEVGT